MRTIAYFIVALSVLATTLVTTRPTNAQDTDSNTITIKTGPGVVPKLPSDACFFATVHVKEIVAMPELKLIPWEVISAAGIDYLGFDPLLIDKLDVVGGFQDGLDSPFRFVYVARTSQRIEFNPQPIHQFPPRLHLVVLPLNDRFILVGDFEYMKRMVDDPPSDGELKKQVARISDTSLVWCALVLAPIQKQLDEMLETASPESRADFETILKKTKLLAARLDLTTSSIPVVLEANSEADAIAIEKVLNKFMTMAKEQETARAAASAERLPKQIGVALVQFTNRFVDELQNLKFITRSGARITARLDQNYYEVSQMSSYTVYIPIVFEAIDQLNQR